MIEVVRDRDGFERLREEWSGLLSRSASNCIFLTWEWLFSWWKHMSGDRRLLILAVRRAGHLVGIGPFAIRPPRPSRLVPYCAIEFLGTGSVGSDYLDLILWPGAEREAIEEVADTLARLRLPLELRQVRTDGSYAGLLASRLAPRGWSLAASRTNVCPFIQLSGLDWPKYLASLGSAHRANLQRRLRGLERIGEVRLEEVGSEQERGEALWRLITLHNDRWSRRGGSDAFDTSASLAFHEELSRAARDHGWLRLMVLSAGGTPLSVFYGFRYGRVFSFYQSGNDPAWKDHSVGLVAMGLAIRRAIEEGAEEFDLLHGAERYKYHWTRRQREIGQMELHPPSMRGWITSSASRLGRAARGLGRRMRSPAENSQGTRTTSAGGDIRA